MSLRAFLHAYAYTSEQKLSLINYYGSFLQPSRFQTMKKVLDQRSKFIIPVLEDVRSDQNISAIIRTVECFGMNDLHVITTPATLPEEKRGLSRAVAKGATNWINIHNHKSSEQCFSELKEKYNCRIIITSPYSIPQLLLGEKRNSNKESHNMNPHPHFEKPIPLTDKHLEKPHYVGMESVPVRFINQQLESDDKPIVLVFGNEAHGVSTTAADMADASLTIPLYGFTESFNVHVSTALATYYLNQRFREALCDSRTKHLAEKHLLSQEEKTNTMLEWLRDSIVRSDELEMEFLRQMGVTIPTTPK